MPSVKVGGVHYSVDLFQIAGLRTLVSAKGILNVPPYKEICKLFEEVYKDMEDSLM